MEKKLGEVITPWGTANIMQGFYGEEVAGVRPLAIWLDGQDDGQRLATISVNMPLVNPGPNQFWALGTEGINATLRYRLLECGVFQDTGIRTEFQGNEFELWRILENADRNPLQVMRSALAQIRTLAAMGLSESGKCEPLSAVRAAALRVTIRDLADKAIRDSQ